MRSNKLKRNDEYNTDSLRVVSVTIGNNIV